MKRTLIDVIKECREAISFRENFSSSPGQIEDFTKGLVFKDFLHEIEIRLEAHRSILEDPEAQMTGREYDIVRGVIFELRNMKLIFHNIAENILEPLEGDDDEP